MKLRNGFVSNSSSSSFICQVCGAEASGWDMCRRDAGMVSCINGHTFCKDHILLADEYEEACEKGGEIDYGKWVALSEEEQRDWRKVGIPDDYQDYEVPTDFCPICSFVEIDPDDVVNYMFKRHEMTRDDILAELRERFASYSELKKFLAEVAKQ